MRRILWPYSNKPQCHNKECPCLTSLVIVQVPHPSLWIGHFRVNITLDCTTANLSLPAASNQQPDQTRPRPLKLVPPANLEACCVPSLRFRRHRFCNGNSCSHHPLSYTDPSDRSQTGHCCSRLGNERPLCCGWRCAHHSAIRAWRPSH